MNNSIAHFGYNTDLEHDSYISSEFMGSKYNFNVSGKVLGVFSNNNQYFLLSQVNKSFGDDCMVGTIDAREVVFQYKDCLISNNEPSEECMTIARTLSSKNTKEELNMGKLIEQTKGFEFLKSLGIPLERQNFQFGETVIVCGIEKSKFENIKNTTMGKTR